MFNKDSDLTELALAKKDIELAIEMRRYEKIFTAEPGILRILNIQNAEEIYIETAHLVEKKIKERREFEANAIKCNNYSRQLGILITLCEDLLARAKEIQMIEEELIAEGKLPKEGYTDPDEHSIEVEEDNYEIELVRE